MSHFVSDRERRLWTWVLVVVVGIVSTLGLARTLSGFLRETGLLGAAFAFGMLLVAAAIVANALKARPGGVEIGIGLGVAAVYLLVLVRMANPVERTHLIEYGVVALLIREALSERARHRRVVAPQLLAVLTASVIGTLDECIQAFLPSRVFDPRDLLFNVLASVMAVVASAALGWARRRKL